MALVQRGCATPKKKKKKESILFICQAKADCQNRCQGVTAAVGPEVSHESQAFRFKLSRRSDLIEHVECEVLQFVTCGATCSIFTSINHYHIHVCIFTA